MVKLIQLLQAKPTTDLALAGVNINPNGDQGNYCTTADCTVPMFVPVIALYINHITFVYGICDIIAE